MTADESEGRHWRSYRQTAPGRTHAEEQNYWTEAAAAGMPRRNPQDGAEEARSDTGGEHTRAAAPLDRPGSGTGAASNMRRSGNDGVFGGSSAGLPAAAAGGTTATASSDGDGEKAALSGREEQAAETSAMSASGLPAAAEAEQTAAGGTPAAGWRGMRATKIASASPRARASGIVSSQPPPTAAGGPRSPSTTPRERRRQAEETLGLPPTYE